MCFQKSNKILLSIVIPTYNSDNLIELCLSNIYKKLGNSNRYQILIIDGFSQDNTITIIEQIARQHKNITYISEKDKGIYDAMNKGILMAKGNFLYFLGADDEILFEMKDIENSLIDDNVIYYGNVIFKDNNRKYDGLFNTKKLIEKNICHQAIFYPREILINNLYNTHYKLLADYELNIRLWKKYIFKYIDISFAIYSNDGISTQMKDIEFRKDFLKIIYTHLGIKYVFLKILNKIKKLLR